VKVLPTNNSNPKKGHHLTQLIKEFATKFPGLATQASAYNKCKFVSYELVLYLRQRGFNARLVHVQNCPLPTYPSPHLKWAAKRRDRWSHYVVSVGRFSIDLTARQFDGDARLPEIKTLAKLRTEWSVVETDLFLNRLARDVLTSIR
jgi:hypothetical protein